MIERIIDDMSRKRLEKIAELTGIPSPTGYTRGIIQYIDHYLNKIGVPTEMTPKGGLKVCFEGENNERQRFITAHVDTLGGIVRAIKPSGRLKMDLIGGFTYNAIEGENCQIHVASNSTIYSGTILMKQTSVHVYRDARTAERNQDNMEVRLDIPVENDSDVRSVGINVGDFISFDPRTEITQEGFIKSRHLDDKVSVAILLEMIEKIQKGQLHLKHTTHFYFSTNEEIGYGGNSKLNEAIEEYIALDMGALGEDQQSDEYTVSICVKDGSGPYHFDLRQKLVNLCEANDIPYKLDIYPYYSSDASAAMRAGADVRHGLFGAGIESSHAYERTHCTSINATTMLVEKYLTSSME